MDDTGRDATERGGIATSNWLNPFQRIGRQTMYCSDCHGTLTRENTVVPGNSKNDFNGKPWGPHGSANPFILKGPWSGDRVNGTGEEDAGGSKRNHLCFNCHAFRQYAGDGNNRSGFAFGGGMCMGMCMGGGGGMMGAIDNLHTFHVTQVTNFRCNLCHVAVPHGWKNKNFLVNLNDVGPESSRFPGSPRGTERRRNVRDGYTDSPYYNRAALKVVFFETSGNWVPGNCGSAGRGGNGITGVNWMAASNEACDAVP
jgi:hypothetical protein